MGYYAHSYATAAIGRSLLVSTTEFVYLKYPNSTEIWKLKIIPFPIFETLLNIKTLPPATSNTSASLNTMKEMSSIDTNYAAWTNVRSLLDIEKGNYPNENSFFQPYLVSPENHYVYSEGGTFLSGSGALEFGNDMQ